MNSSIHKDLALLVCLIFLMSWAVASEPFMFGSPDSRDFCTRRVALKLCPTPPTVDNLDLRGLLGSFYEIGTTARYKLRSEGGLVCAQSNFSVDMVPPSLDSNSMVTIDVQSTGIRVVGVQSISALSKISYSASDVCANAARMCAMLESSSKLSEAILRVGSVSQDTTGSSPSETSKLGQVSAIINTSVANVKTRLDDLASCITVISRIAAELSQGVNPLKPLLQALRATVTLGTSNVNDLGVAIIGNLTLSRNLIAQVMGQVTSANSVELLFEASALIEQEIELLSIQVSRIQGLLSSIGGPWADMVEADAVLTNKTQSVIATKGQAMQNSDQRGDMVLKVKQTTQPYQIIALEGLSFLGYSSLLAYSCKLDSNGDPAGDLYLLSRLPTMPAAAINFFLTTASRYGISMDCDSVFVPTVQKIDNSDYQQCIV